MSLMTDFDGFFGIDSDFVDSSCWGLHPVKEFDDRISSRQDGGELPQEEELDLLGAVQPDLSLGTLGFNSLSMFLWTCDEAVKYPKSIPEDLSNLLDDRRRVEEGQSGDSARSESGKPTASGASKNLMDEFLRLKLDDRRRRNRESSSRCYYKRKKRVAAVKENLKQARHQAFLLSSRRKQLIEENAWLRKKIASQGHHNRADNSIFERPLMC